MPFEIDVLDVGNADAIILRYIDDKKQEHVVLIDAGNVGDGTKIINHINKYTNKKSIDLAILTHPDDDHIGGFFEVVENVHIKQFWIHDPAKNLKTTKLMLESSGRDYFEKSIHNLYESLTGAKNLLGEIDKKGIKRDVQPFAGISAKDLGIPLTVVGPSRDHYQKLLRGFRGIDKLAESLVNENLKNTEEFLEKAEKINQQFRIFKTNDYSKENNSSVLLLFEPRPGKKFLFCADVGPSSLKLAMEEYNLENLRWLKVPHHGSKYNLTEKLIDKLDPDFAYISCAADLQYPNREIVGYLSTKGCKVFATCECGDLMLAMGMPDRENYVNATPLKINN